MAVKRPRLPRRVRIGQLVYEVTTDRTVWLEACRTEGADVAGSTDHAAARIVIDSKRRLSHRGGLMSQPRFEVRKGKVRRRYHVVLIAENGEILSTSETLNSVAAVHTNIEAQLEAVPLVKRIDWPD